MELQLQICRFLTCDRFALLSLPPTVTGHLKAPTNHWSLTCSSVCSKSKTMGPKPNEWNDVTDLEHSEMFTTDSYRPAEALGSMGGH